MDPSDEEKLIVEVNRRIDSIPPLARPVIRGFGWSVDRALAEVPEYLYKYTVRDIVETLKRARRDRRLKDL